MKLTFKDLAQKKFVLEVDPVNTIEQVKAQIEAEHGHPAGNQKLIYSGKVLANDKTVESYNVKEKDFIVCMVSKPKPAPSAASSATETKSAPVPATAPAAAAPPSTPAAQISRGTPQAPNAPPPAAATSTANFNDPNALAMGSQREGAINNMVEMGYDRADAERAMRAAFNNPDRAVEYLLTGIPENIVQEQAAMAQAAAAARQQGSANTPSAEANTETAATATSPPPAQTGNLFEQAAAAAAQQQGTGQEAAPGFPTGAGGGGAVEEFEAIRQLPQFQQLRQAIQQQPQLLEPILHQMAQANPQLAGLISQNPEAFLQLLSEGAEDEGGVDAPRIMISQEDLEPVQRLQALGFSWEVAAMAFVACDKNEELAANYLFEHGHDDDEEEGGAGEE